MSTVPRYATQTSVSVERSRAEVERILRRYGADQFVSGWDRKQALIGFKMDGKQVRFVLPLPDRQAAEFTQTPSGRHSRSETAAETAWEQACRQRWRALALVIKAKLEAVESGITTMEEEFLAHMVLPDGSTVGSWTTPQLEEVYRTGRMPEMLPGLPSGDGVIDAEEVES